MLYVIIHMPTNRAYHPKAITCPLRTVPRFQARLYRSERGARAAWDQLYERDDFTIFTYDHLRIPTTIAL